MKHQRQKGQAVVIVGAMIVALTILGTMVFDVGLAVSDRRNLQAYADSAALAGSRSYSQGVNRAHWVAMQYRLLHEPRELPGRHVLRCLVPDHPDRLIPRRRDSELPHRA